MKNIQWKKLAALNLLVVLIIVSPFIPGPSNKVVLALSSAGQITGFFGLLLVPIGLAWTLIETRKLSNYSTPASHFWISQAAIGIVAAALLVTMIVLPNPMPKVILSLGLVLIAAAYLITRRQLKKWEEKGEVNSEHRALVFLAGAAVACSTFVYLFLSLMLLATEGVTTAVAAFLLLPPGMLWALRQVRKLGNPGTRGFNQMPLYLMTVPLFALATTLLLVDPASDFSRRYAIRRSLALIASIEDYRNQNGQYPESISQLSSALPKPFIMGIDDFRYNKINDRYSLSFSQWPKLGLEEIVLYDKDNLRDNFAQFKEYDYNVDLWRVKGAFASFDAGYNHWRYYKVD